MEHGIHAQRVRDHARNQYIAPARKNGQTTVQIVAGEVQKAVHLSNRIALVCAALKSKKFLSENRLELERRDGPPSGMSTTVVFTYRLLSTDPQAERSSFEAAFLKVRGVAKEAFQRLGGGEAFIKRQREHFYDPEPRS